MIPTPSPRRPMPPSGPIEMPPPAQPAEAEATPEQEAQKPVPPYAVAYHTGDETCGRCEYYNGGQCSWLQMAVDENGHCTLFEAGGETQGTNDDSMVQPDDTAA